MKPHITQSKGFTLLEVMIAVTILAFLAIATSEAIQRAVKSKSKVQKTIDRVSEVRDALRIMERDINKAFNYRDINIALYNAAIEERKKRLQEKRNKKDDKNKKDDENDDNNDDQENQDEQDDLAGPGWKRDGGPGGSSDEEALQKKEEVILTHFQGDTESVHFTSLGNIRSTVDAKESNQAEVGYYVESCTNRVNKDHSSQCLWRRVSPIIDDDVTRGGTATPLLENVQEFKLRYLGPDNPEEWTSQWRSDAQGETTHNKFPYAVEVTIETKDESREDSKATRMTMVASIRFPNNPKKEEAQGANSGTSQAPGPFPTGP